jgi:hypothetical protein
MWYTKSVGSFVIAAACLSWLACNAMARGVGQGEHEADSGGGFSFGGGYKFSGGVGQGHYGPGGPYGAAVPSGMDTSAVGQAQHGGGGSGYYQSAPALESSPVIGSSSLIAARPSGGDPHYRFANGVWFYQMPDNSWVRWENGSWVKNDSAVPAQRTTAPVERSIVSDPHYRYSNGTWFYQMPDNHLVRWDNGKWVNADQTATVQPNVGPIAERTTALAGRR